MESETKGSSYPSHGLDGFGELYIYTNMEDDDQSHHQADAADITVSDDFGSFSAETDLDNRYERFHDIGGHEEEIQRVPSPELQDVQHQQPPSSRVSSPPTSHHEPPTEHEPMVEEQEEQQPEDQTNAAQEPDGAEPRQRQRNSRRRAGGNLSRVIKLDGRTQNLRKKHKSWLQNASSNLRKRITKA